VCEENSCAIQDLRMLAKFCFRVLSIKIHVDLKKHVFGRDYLKSGYTRVMCLMKATV
jgi:hypothetical protein